MARRKKKDEEADWTPPEFDEVGYMRREMEGARAAVATIAWAVVGAIVSFLLFAVYAPLAFFAGIAVGFGLYFVLPLMGINTDGFKRRDWTGHGITYFFSWLAFWIILLNPPFGDFTDPTIQGASVSPYHANYTLGPLLCAAPVAGTVDIPNSNSGGNDSLYILFRATDNVGLSTLTVTVKPGSGAAFNPTITPATGSDRCIGQSAATLPAGSYNVTIPLGPSLYQVEIKAVDTSGHSATADFQILPH